MSNAAIKDDAMSTVEDFFVKDLSEVDAEVYEATRGELNRQQTQIELIASENITSKAVLDAQGDSVH